MHLAMGRGRGGRPVVDIGRRVNGRRLHTKLLIRYCIFTSVHSAMYTLFTPLLYPSMTNSLPLHLYHEAASLLNLMMSLQPLSLSSLSS